VLRFRRGSPRGKGGIYIIYYIIYYIYMAKDEECFASEEVLHVEQVREMFYMIYINT